MAGKSVGFEHFAALLVLVALDFAYGETLVENFTRCPDAHPWIIAAVREPTDYQDYEHDDDVTIADDPKHLGTRIGLMVVLYTWVSAMTHHPHVYMIVPGGGFTEDRSR